MRWVWRTNLVLLTLVFTAAAAWAFDDTVETIDRSFTVDGTPELFVRNVDGRTTLDAHEGAEVRVRAIKRVTRASSEADAKEAADEVEVRIEQIGDRIEVEARYPRRSFWGRGPRVLVDFEISAPRLSDVDAKSVDGPLEAAGFEGELRFETVDGDLRAEACTGRISAEAVDGDLLLDQVEGTVEAHAVDGEMRIDGILGALRAESTDGDITVRVRPSSTMEDDWSIRTTDGSIQLVLPDGFAADLNVRAGDGEIEIDHPVTITGKLSRHSFRGPLNGGAYELMLRSSDGDIEIR